MSGSSAASSKISRSVYVAQLRRAFLLRAHPDRFRNFDDGIRRGQATLLQALSERLSAQDFQDYTSNFTPSSPPRSAQNRGGNVVPYVLEKRDGSLLKQTLQLNDSVENVLKNLATALELSGAASLPPPPPAATTKRRPATILSHQELEDMMWAPEYTNASNNPPDPDINHQFDINSNRGRDLFAFLNSISAEQIEEQRAARMDAAALALVARRLYSFQAIDGVSMDWSSDSLAILLRSLIRLHEEHSSRFLVDSFYPLRLVFSHDTCHSSLDVYGGVLYMHPAFTQIQMLETIKEVTEERLETCHRHRLVAMENVSLIQKELDARISKGYSCTSHEYHTFLELLVMDPTIVSKLESNPSTSETTSASLERAESSLIMEPLRITVESPSACRRAQVTKEGFLRVHSNMTMEELRSAVARLSKSARRRREEEKQAQQRCKEAIKEIQWAIGLHKVYRSGVLSHDQFIGALSRMMEHQSKLRNWLAGYSLGIAGEGQFCHLGDDGSLVVPHNWT